MLQMITVRIISCKFQNLILILLIDCRQLHEIATKDFLFLQFDTKLWNRRFGACNLRRILDVKYLESFFFDVIR